MISWMAMGFNSVSLILIIGEFTQMPSQLMCTCPAMKGRHGGNAYMFVEMVCAFAVCVLYTIAAGFGAASMVWGFIGLSQAGRWWRHSRGGRKKLKEKVLGVVRAWAGGLRVEPVSHGV